VPAGKAVSLSYNGSPTPPTDAGSYTVVGTVSDSNYEGSATATLVIGKALANVTLDNLAATYDGSAKAASATTTPEGLTVNLTYNGSVTAPTNAGNYELVATISDANYQGTATGTLVIGKALANITLGNLAATYDGSAKAASATTTPEGLTVNLTYNGSVTAPTNAGNYELVATISDANYQGTATGTFVIGKALANVTLDNLAATYDGSAKAASATTTPQGLTVNLTYNGSATAPTNAGNYELVATISDANYQGTATGTFVIGKALANVTLDNLAATYDGSAKAASATTTPEGLTVNLTYNGSVTAPTNAGSYAVIATISDANYEGTATGTFVIGKALANVTLDNLAATYDGSAKAASATTTPQGLTVNLTYNGSVTAPTNAGSYAVIATMSDANYQGSANSTLVIAAATQTIDFTPPTSYPLDGTGLSLSATASSGLPVNLALISGVATFESNQLIPLVVGPVTVRATQAGNGNFLAAEPVDVVINITHTYLASAWRNQYFNATELADTSVSGSSADPDGDGLNNLLEYALNLNPLIAGPSPVVATRVTVGANEYLALSFRRRLKEAGIEYAPQISDSLDSWNEESGTPHLIEFGAAIHNNDGTETVQYRSSVPFGNSKKEFIRLKVSAP
jgi:hypothetical protein